MVYRGGGKSGGGAAPTFATYATDPTATTMSVDADGEKTILNDVNTRNIITKDGAEWEPDTADPKELFGLLATGGLNTGAPTQKFKDTNAAKRGIQI